MVSRLFVEMAAESKVWYTGRCSCYLFYGCLCIKMMPRRMLGGIKVLYTPVPAIFVDTLIELMFRRNLQGEVSFLCVRFIQLAVS